MGFADDHAADRDKFVILTIHDPQATDFAMLDEKLKPIIRRQWRGRSLPFPILLDTTGETVKDYGVVWWPTVILLDPEGRVVDVPGGDRPSCRGFPGLEAARPCRPPRGSPGLSTETLPLTVTTMTRSPS